MLRVLAFAGAVLTGLFLSACSGEEQAPAAADPAAILARAASAVAGVSTFHFKLTHENGTTAMPLNFELVSAEGDVVVPDRLAAEVTARAITFNVSLRVVGIDDRTWVTNPFTRRWQELPGATLSDIADPASLVVALVQGLAEVRIGETLEIAGETGYRLEGVLESDALRAAVPTAGSGHLVSVDLWISGADWLPRRARIAGRLSGAEPENIVRQIEFSRFNASVEISAPE